MQIGISHFSLVPYYALFLFCALGLTRARRPCYPLLSQIDNRKNEATLMKSSQTEMESVMQDVRTEQNGGRPKARDGRRWMTGMCLVLALGVLAVLFARWKAVVTPKEFQRRFRGARRRISRSRSASTVGTIHWRFQTDGRFAPRNTSL